MTAPTPRQAAWSEWYLADRSGRTLGEDFNESKYDAMHRAFLAGLAAQERPAPGLGTAWRLLEEVRAERDQLSDHLDKARAEIGELARAAVADRDDLARQPGKLRILLDDFTHAVIDLDDGARFVGIDRLAAAARAVREKAGLPPVEGK